MTYAVNTVAKLTHRAYKLLVSPFLGNQCRFEPTCSDYALKAVETHGLFRGGLLAIYRIIRCNPYNKGGYDPVLASKNKRKKDT